jgi:hypothetical protein
MAVDIIDEDTFERVAAEQDAREVSLQQAAALENIKESVTPKQQAIMNAMKDPVAMQKEIAAKVKIVLDETIERELRELDGGITENTRKLIATYNDMLTCLQKAQYGEKSVHLHQHQVSVGQISNFIRKHRPSTTEVTVDAAGNISD